MSQSERYYTISEVADQIGRVSHTLRVWGYDDRLPDHLKPTRNERGWRVWTQSQIEGIKRWIIEEDIRPGKGLENARKTQNP